jgi:hypothetical protein
MIAELAARRTAAAAVAGDFDREAHAFIHDDSLTMPRPEALQPEAGRAPQRAVPRTPIR